jgi:hypothetical protein
VRVSGSDEAAVDDDLVDAFWTHHRLVTSSDRAERMRADDWFWAWERVQEVVHETGAGALPLLVLLCDAAPDNGVGLVGAGPIEALLWEYGASVVDAVIGAARANPGFARELSMIYPPRNLSEGDLERLRRSIDP